MELSGIVLQVFEEKEIDGLKQRIIRIKADVKDQILDIYCYNKLSFRTGFLNIGEKVTFLIILRGIPNKDRYITQIVLLKPIKPNLELTKDHPFVDKEWIRKDSQGAK
jgi:hypothetical protein